MLVSRFSHFFSYGDGAFALAYNARTNALFSIPGELYRYFSECRESGGEVDPDLFDGPLRDLLQKGKFIVDAQEDDFFVNQLQYAGNIYAFSRSALKIVLAPTTHCNFRCSYCFEPHKGLTTMSVDTQRAFIDFLKRHEEAKRISLVWYGGEPLMAIGVIERLLPEIDALGLAYTHSMITNGYYFTDRAIALFSRYPLQSVQVTLDGEQARHDSIRCDYRTGKPSFERIVRNMDQMLEKLPSTFLSVRVNIERSNYEDFLSVKRMLTSRWKGYSNFEVYPGIIRIDNAQGTDYSPLSLNYDGGQEFFTSAMCRQEGKDMYPKRIPKHCSANQLNSYVIGPQGEIYKCWNDVSNPDKVVGNIAQDHFTNDALYQDYMTATLWYNRDECRKCGVLPICNGGCPWYLVRNLRDGARFNTCVPYRNPAVLQQVVLQRYNQINSRP